jgi:hypothetical protein
MRTDYPFIVRLLLYNGLKTHAQCDVVHKMVTRHENTSFTTLQQTPFDI